MSSKEKIQFTGNVPPQEAAQYLESLARGLRERTMLLESGDASITVEVPDEVKVTIDASNDGEKGKTAIEVSLSMRRPAAEAAPAAPGLLIVPGAPAEPSTFAE